MANNCLTASNILDVIKIEKLLENYEIEKAVGGRAFRSENPFLGNVKNARTCCLTLDLFAA